MTVQVNIKGGALKALLNAVAERSTVEAANAIAGKVSDSLTQGYTAIDGPSQPGEPPHLNTGQLHNSVRTEFQSPEHKRLVVGASYSIELEYGAPGKAARPFIRPAVIEVSNE